MSVASSGEIDGNSEYVESPENLPTRFDNMSELKGHILDLQQIRDITEDKLDDITHPAKLYTHPYKLDPTELSDNRITANKNHKGNVTLPLHGIQPSSPHSPLTDALFATDEPLSRPHIDNGRPPQSTPQGI